MLMDISGSQNTEDLARGSNIESETTRIAYLKTLGLSPLEVSFQGVHAVVWYIYWT